MDTAYCATSTKPGVEQLVLHAGARIDDAVPVGAQSCLIDLGRHLEAVVGREPLPLDREGSVPLQIAERPVVAQDVEPVARALPRAARLVAPVRPVADARAKDLGSLIRRHRSCDREQLVVRQVRGLVQHRRGDLQLAVRVVIGERDLLARLGLLVGEHARREGFDAFVVLLPVARPRDASFRDVDPREELRDDLPEFGEDQLTVGAHLGEWMRREAHHQLLVCLSGGVDPQVGTGAGRQQHAERVARLGQHRLAVHEVTVPRFLRVALLEPVLHWLVHAPVGREDLVEERAVATLERCVDQLRRNRGAPRVAGPVVVAHVPRGLLQVGGEPAPFQGLREQL